MSERKSKERKVRKENQGHMQVFPSLHQNAIKISTEEFVNSFISNLLIILNNQYQYGHIVLTCFKMVLPVVIILDVYEIS